MPWARSPPPTITPWRFDTTVGHLPVGTYTVMLRIHSLSGGFEYPPRLGHFVVGIPLYLPLVTTLRPMTTLGTLAVRNRAYICEVGLRRLESSPRRWAAHNVGFAVVAATSSRQAGET